TVTLQDKFYLMYRSYENDDALGGTGKCVSIQMSEKNEETKTTKSTMKYRDPQTNSLIKKTVRVTLAPSDGSAGGDTIQIGDAEGGDTSATKFQFVHSDYGTCDVVVVLGTGERKCELWVNADAVGSDDDESVNEKIAKCINVYNKQCPDQKKYEIYDEATCNSLETSSK
ncbi:uncharacterized protein LOC115321335, partial [Ixodes scapularis]|uniref:uncharacterized protein LOC115321335 n=1 Tax=Ixodes scapularis TaxID=6945 RepID=UPI001C38EEB3